MSKWPFIVLLVCVFAAGIGCNGMNEPAGGPGADVRDDQDQEPQDEAFTFTASLDEEAIELPAGSQKELVLSIDRGDQFEQTVTAEVQPPQGISVEPRTVEYQAGQQEGKIFLQATPDAQVGQEMAVAIQFEPESGQPITKQLKVTITEPEAGGQNQQGNQEQGSQNAPQQAQRPQQQQQ